MAIDKKDPKFQELRTTMRELYDEFKAEDLEKAKQEAANNPPEEKSILDVLFNR